MCLEHNSPDAPAHNSTERPLSPVQCCLLGLVRCYQLTLSAVLGPTCRFFPSCSVYAVEAIRLHGALRGCWLSLQRIARCHPWSEGGYDPVPPAFSHLSSQESSHRHGR